MGTDKGVLIVKFGRTRERAAVEFFSVPSRNFSADNDENLGLVCSSHCREVHKKQKITDSCFRCTRSAIW
jgi:hypothetical protein